MKYRSVFAALAAGVLLMGANISAANPKPPAAVAQAQESEPKVGKKNSAQRRAEIAAKRKAHAQIKPIDINSASAAELKKLGIDDATAEKIIAGRPYGSKAWLATRNIIPEAVFMSIKDKIVAKQTFKTPAEIEAAYSNKK